jgi:hypothetical protein
VTKLNANDEITRFDGTSRSKLYTEVTHLPYEIRIFYEGLQLSFLTLTGCLQEMILIYFKAKLVFQGSGFIIYENKTRTDLQ